MGTEAPGSCNSFLRPTGAAPMSATSAATAIWTSWEPGMTGCRSTFGTTKASDQPGHSAMTEICSDPPSEKSFLRKGQSGTAFDQIESGMDMARGSTAITVAVHGLEMAGAQT